MIAVDTNVLIYAHRAETDLHAVAARELVLLAEGTTVWGLPLFCVGEFIRVVTHRRILNPPSTLPQAVSFLDRVLASPSCRIVRPGPDFVGLLTAASLAAGARGNLVFDAQIVALCREHGVSTILTDDRDFLRFKSPALAGQRPEVMPEQTLRRVPTLPPPPAVPQIPALVGNSTCLRSVPPDRGGGPVAQPSRELQCEESYSFR